MMGDVSRDRFVPALLAAGAGLGAHVLGAGGLVAVGAAAAGALVGGLMAWPWPGDARAGRAPPAREPHVGPDPAQALISRLIDAVPFGLIVVDGNQQIQAANTAAMAMFGLPRLSGLPVETLRARRLLDAVHAAAASGRPRTLELALSRAHELSLRAHVHPFGTATGGRWPVVVTIEDETAARQTEALHRDFVANASHELKTPLTVVMGLIDTLLGPARTDPAATERFLGLLSVHVDRMTRLINDLMSLNRIELDARVVPTEPLVLGRLVGEAIDAMRPVAAAASVELRAVLPEQPLPSVRGDRQQLSQVVVNLIDNAIKYGGGNPVTVSVTPDGNGAPPDWQRISIRDSGPGIAREHVPRLTERFYRVDIDRSREKGGTGLGLAICKHIVSRHRGRLEIESTVGEGACFSVLLPCPADPAEPVVSSGESVDADPAIVGAGSSSGGPRAR